MTKEEIKEYLPYIEAVAKGKTIQVMVLKNSSGITWQDVDNPEFIKGHLYRIKPDAEYRPFNSKEECWNEMLKHSPFGWVTDGSSNYNINIIDDKVIVVGDCEAAIWTRSYMAALDALKFVDGKPFGIETE